jgi:hypothetical protein
MIHPWRVWDLLTVSKVGPPDLYELGVASTSGKGHDLLGVSAVQKGFFFGCLVKGERYPYVRFNAFSLVVETSTYLSGR